MAEANKYVIEMHDIVKTFPGVRALNHVNFSLKEGEIRSIVGKNGAGKSTLMNILTGIYQPDQGDIFIKGQLIKPMTTEKARQLGIAYVHQHSQLIPALSIAENIFLGDLLTEKTGLVNWKKVRTEAEAQLSELGLTIDVQRKVEDLSIAEKQLLEIAKALFANAHTIVLDEATAPLPKEDVQMLFDFVKRMSAQGVAFIYISHYLVEVFELCKAVTVLRDGKNIGDYYVSDLDQPELIHLISGEKVEKFHREHHKLNGEKVLEFRNVTKSGHYKNINFALNKGEIVGITGLEGSGKAKLVRGLFGLESSAEFGEIMVDGSIFNAKDPEKAINEGVAYLPRDRHGLGIIGARPVSENITLSILKRLANKLGFLNLSNERKHVEDYVDKLGIVTPSTDQLVQFLSGGNQQKVVFAKLASTEPKVLLLNEPTQGVDVQAKVEIMKIVDQLSRQGVGVIIVSEEILELVDVCDRIIVIYNGEIMKEFNTKDRSTTPEKVLMAIEGETKNK